MTTFPTGTGKPVKWGKFVQGDLLNKGDLRQLFAGDSFDAVMHPQASLHKDCGEC
ncbi:MAG: hypothetical protein L6271_12805 [Desulfobacteraceae bacterium]|nr:hypothetical protein [Desulfobacteraceae bacterium]